jgi:beta-galactosidase
MEQQPGPVNWARHNPRPEPGMVRLWSWVSFAHGADVVSYFRWRQAPFAQEQMHAGLKRIDNSKAAAWPEIEQLVRELALCPDLLQQQVKATVAIVSTTENQWVCEIERQGESFNQQEVEFAWYSALRQLGVDVDFVSPEQDFSGYKMVLVPCMPIVRPDFVQRCQASGAVLVFGPRTGSKTTEFQLVPQLAPGLLQPLLPVKVLSVETIRPDCADPLLFGTEQYESFCWREELEVTPSCQVLARYHDGLPAVVQHQRAVYVATVSCDAFLKALFAHLLPQAGIEPLTLPQDVRLARRGGLNFLFNYSAQPSQVTIPSTAQWLLGSATLDGYGVAIYR